MQITGEIPRSTIAVAVILWGVLASLGAWTLNMVSDMRAEVRGQSESIKAVNARIDGIERQVERNAQDIREMQRTAR